MEAVKQGSACVGVRSRTHAVLVALKRAHNDMSSYQKKVMLSNQLCVAKM
jgi:20S proteasome subunit alpha 6